METKAPPLHGSRQQPSHWPLEELRVVVLYIFFASVWVIGSDMALDWMEHEPREPISLQTFKGLNFVLTTAVLLYAVLRRSYNRWRRAEQKIERSRLQLRALSARLQSLREEERTRIAREIHDELGQMLTGLKMDLRWIERRLSQSEGPGLNALLDKVVEAGELADATITTVQRISTELRPGLLDMLGLSAAVRHEAARFQERTGIVCRVACPDLPPALTPDAATTVFRIFQEAMTNVTRHAQATEVTIELQAEGGQLRLQVADNGIGVKSADVDHPKSLGLLGMKERATLLGGELVVGQGADRGTIVTLRLPVSAVRADPTLALI